MRSMTVEIGLVVVYTADAIWAGALGSSSPSSNVSNGWFHVDPPSADTAKLQASSDSKPRADMLTVTSNSLVVQPLSLASYNTELVPSKKPPCSSNASFSVL